MDLTYSVENLTYTFHLPANEPQEKALAEKLGNNVTVKDVFLDIKGVGLRLGGSNGELDFRFEPEVGWDDFLAQTGCDHNATGIEACRIWNRWKQWSDDNNADYFLSQIEQGDLNFEDIPNLKRSLYKHPKIKEALLHSVEKGTPINNKKGKLPQISDNVLKLYNWASYYYITSEETNWETACDKACEAHPELVPDKWKEDPGGTLKREAYRKLDPHPFLHQSRTKLPSGQN